MSVRAKFRVHNVKPNNDGSGIVELHPVYSSDPESENAKFYQATPWGSITMGTVNKVVLDEMQPGKVFYVDFTEAPAA